MLLICFFFQSYFCFVNHFCYFARLFFAFSLNKSVYFLFSSLLFRTSDRSHNLIHSTSIAVIGYMYVRTHAQCYANAALFSIRSVCSSCHSICWIRCLLLFLLIFPSFPVFRFSFDNFYVIRSNYSIYICWILYSVFIFC